MTLSVLGASGGGVGGWWCRGGGIRRAHLRPGTHCNEEDEDANESDQHKAGVMRCAQQGDCARWNGGSALKHHAEAEQECVQLDTACDCCEVCEFSVMERHKEKCDHHAVVGELDRQPSRRDGMRHSYDVTDVKDCPSEHSHAERPR
eukprot:CAMPEP_0179941558 /NCGR_PEP_ID=MMETSP0983-20121128/17055_1 /TAXON_ID=483367 /ORGANISM="non described non described, Strain CCMP 2436" /LENGTH=146 /DNA_ID=CAMNT_0021848617 /DNA_START=551 /DNA_END=991 /DNA_ORIENTATION=-